MKDREYKRATDTFMEAVLTAPDAGFPKLLFGHALFAAGDYDYAGYAIGRAIDRIDDLDAVSPGVDDLYRDADEFERLVYKLRDHVRRHNLDADAHFLLGYFRYFAGDYESAVRSFDQALRLNRVHRHATALRKLARAKPAASSQDPEVDPEPADDE